VVVIDPPRKGASKEFLEQLLEFAPRRLVYMSCGPDTQARDAAILLASGKYELLEVVPFDLFPQTRHIESCAVFERRDV
jgi:tRNA/tmRNA/rRNA uracil-C5-methylase (TrmA/RlmC/RlmD family)